MPPASEKSSNAAPPDTKDGAEDAQRPEGAGEGEVKLDDAAQALIGQHLKAIYGEIVQQPVPDRFLELLEELERKERGK